MQGIQEMLVHDLFLLLEDDVGCSLDDTAVMVSFFELYSGSIQDLLNERARLKVLEDGNGEINLTGLTEVEANDPQQLLEILEGAANARTTHVTEANDSSSRSHAICQICLRDRKNDTILKGKLSLVDLAGSERGSDTKSHNAQRRGESAEINTSLLALKECIRALDPKNSVSHVPYRSSKLTLLLKDCFTSDRAMTSMIATVSPGASAADHSLNTLRYADRIKEKGTDAATAASKKFSPVPATASSKSPVRFGKVSPKPSGSSISGVPKSTNGASSGAVQNRPAMKKTTTTATSVILQTTETLLQQQRQQNELAERDEEEVEAILGAHMSNIQENAELLTMEGELLADVQKANRRTPSDLERYASALEEILDQKEDMVLKLRQQMQHLQKRRRSLRKA
jgi:kinesin family member 2/24